MESRGQRAMAQRSEEGREEWAAEQEEDLHGTAVAEEERLRGEESGGFDSQRMHSNGEQGSQTRSLPVSR